jgi:hypothetical protein
MLVRFCRIVHETVVGEKIRSKAATFLKWCLIRSSQLKFYAHFWGQAPYNWGSDKSANWMASRRAGRVKKSATLWELAFYQHSSSVGLCCKTGLRIFECVESLSLQELAFITIHPMLACAVKELMSWNQYCSRVNYREPLSIMWQHNIGHQLRSYISYGVSAFWYFPTSLAPFFHVPHQWLPEHHNLPSRVSSNQYAWHCMIDYMWWRAQG